MRSPIKKILALLLSSAALLLTACGQTSADSTSAAAFTVPTADSAAAPQSTASPIASGATVALVANTDGTEDGADGQLWQGVQAFAETYGCAAQSNTAGGSSVDDAEAALRSAAESGATMIVCRGQTMAEALYRLQDSYPGVSYLLFDDEPHGEDYTSYTTSDSVHCVLFQEEQAGYLSGYAAVTDGYTALGFVGVEEQPGNVRYCTGFLQGAEDAAEQQGLQVTLRTWYTGTDADSDAVTQRMISWFQDDGIGLIFAQGDANAARALDAVGQTAAKAITTDIDRTAQGDRILGSAIKCYSAAVQAQLYNFYTNGGAWGQDTAGQTQRVGVNEGLVALVAGDPWRFEDFSASDYEKIYLALREGTAKAESYADMETLPDTPSVTVEQMN